MADAQLAPQHLADGTPYFGRLGKLARDLDTGEVQCHLCGGWFRRLGGSHLHRAHGWTVDRYRDAFHLPRTLPTCCEDLSARARDQARARVGQGGFGRGGPSRKGASQPTNARPWRSLTELAPELARELHPTRNPGLDVSKLALKANRRVWWLCAVCRHEWRALVSSRADGRGCPACARRRIADVSRQRNAKVPPGRSVAALRPDLLAIWDERLNAGRDPSAIAVGSSRRVWWRCPACHGSWQATVNSRSRAARSLCPTCARSGVAPPR